MLAIALCIGMSFGCPGFWEGSDVGAEPAGLVGVTDGGEAVALVVHADGRVEVGAATVIDRPEAWSGGVLSNLHENGKGDGLVGYDHRSGVLLEMSADARVVQGVRHAGAVGHQRMRGMAVTELGAIVLLDAPTNALVVVTENGSKIELARLDGAARMEAIAMGGDGVLYGVGHASGGVSRTLYTIDLASGSTTEIATLPVRDLDALTWASDGMLYATDADGSRPARLYRIDPRTGVCTDLGEVFGGTITALSSSPRHAAVGWVGRGCG